MEEVEIQVKSLCCGNEEIDMFFDEHKISFYASYLGQEPMASLIQAVYELEECGGCDMGSDEVRYESEARWLAEPGFLTMEFRRIGDTLHIHLRTSDDFEGKFCLEEELRFYVPFQKFKEAVVRESLRILREYGIKGYFESWGDQREFPLSMLLTLLGCTSDEKVMGMYTSDLNTEYKLLTQKTNDYGTSHGTAEV